jgi:hypothetical protein
MVLLPCFRQGKNLSKNLRESLRSLPWGTHHIADVTDLKFCLLLSSFFDGRSASKALHQSAFDWRVERSLRRRDGLNDGLIRMNRR